MTARLQKLLSQILYIKNFARLIRSVFFSVDDCPVKSVEIAQLSFKTIFSKSEYSILLYSGSYSITQLELSIFNRAKQSLLVEGKKGPVARTGTSEQIVY